MTAAEREVAAAVARALEGVAGKAERYAVKVLLDRGVATLREGDVSGVDDLAAIAAAKALEALARMIRAEADEMRPVLRVVSAARRS